MNTFVAGFAYFRICTRRERISSECSMPIFDVGYGQSSFTRREETVFFSGHC